MKHPDHGRHLLGVGDRAQFAPAVGPAVDADPADLALQVEQIPTEPGARVGVGSKSTSRPSWRAASRKVGR
jgi:hypothetical protein